MTHQLVAVLRRLASRARRGRLDDELRDEIDQHIDLRREQLIEDGMDPRDAAYEARRMFGNPTAVREQAQRVWSVGAVDSLAQDVRFAARLVDRAPAFTATVVLSLALGIAASASVFQLADALLFRPLAARAPGELRAFHAVQRIGAATKVMGGVDDETFSRIERSAFTPIAGSRHLADITLEEPPAGAIRAEAVSPNYFALLGVALLAGTFPAQPAASSGPMPVMLSERLWRGAFAADRSIVGRAITLDARRYVVSGVLRDFRGLDIDEPADVFVPLAAGATSNRMGEGPIRLVLRVGGEMEIAEAEQRMAALFKASSSRIIPGAHVEVQLVPAGHGLSEARDRLARPVTLGLTLALVLLVMASANAGGLLLARLASRRGEFAIRIAIGAGRARLVRQLAVEAVMLGALAAVAGLFAAAATGPLLARSIPSTSPIEYDLRFDWRLVAFTISASLIASLTAVAASVLRLVRADVRGLLASESRSMLSGSRRSTRLLVTAQIACTMLLLVGAAALTRTLLNLRNVPAGFAAGELFAIDVDANRRTDDRVPFPDYLAALLDRISAAPLVASATLAQFGLMVDAQTTGTMSVGGFTPATDEDRWVRVYFVGPRYFETLGMPLLAGRDVEPGDRTGRERVAVVNERLARFYFGSAAVAVGRTVNDNVRIIGVAADARYDTLRDDPARVMFVPYLQAPPRQRMTVLVRAAADRTACVGAVLETVRSFDPALRPKVTTGDAWISAALARERFLASVALAVALLASGLACAGLYAAVAASTAQRKGEIAMRIALGASRRNILAFVLRDPSHTTVTGIAAGVLAAAVMTRLITSLLFGVRTIDVAAIAVCALLMTLVAAAATLGPAFRAARMDPAAALRDA